jgi:glycosyltransferase involved in cell wall biosynthesis
VNATVAIPTLNGGPQLGEVLAAVADQDSDAHVETLICDSGSDDDTVAIARDSGANVIEIPRSRFSHGGTRNLLMARSRSTHVAFLTQDAVPADPSWLQGLLDGFALADDVGLVFGPYRARPGASPMVTRELCDWFASFSPDGRVRVDRLSPAERGLPARELLGPRGFFTDANGCVSRAAWERVPFRDVPFAEDHVLAHDMMRAGLAKVYLPDAGVIHSHEYSPLGWLRRSFDEGRALSEIYGWAQPADPRKLMLAVRGRVGGDWRWVSAGAGDRLGPRRTTCLLSRSSVHHAARLAGSVLGGRADRIPPQLQRLLSSEGRSS